MRTEHGKSFIESAPDPFRVGDPDLCEFCARQPQEDVRRVVYSRNGYQHHAFSACLACRLDLIAHLSART